MKDRQARKVFRRWWVAVGQHEDQCSIGITFHRYMPSYILGFVIEIGFWYFEICLTKVDEDD